MLLTASTVKDTLPNIERFVTGNLAGGVDHLVVFLDADQPDVRAWLDAHPHVTCVPTDHTWWTDGRPDDLNVRQRINANVVKAVATRLAWVEWVFHIDADEIVQVDREVLAGLPPETRVVGLAPLEAVSQVSWDGDPTLFKRLLGRPDLARLRDRGTIARAHNGAYFHGHVDGKTGIRPSLDLWLTLHQAVDEAGQEQERYVDDRLALLHFESYSGEDFVRKWTSILSAGTVPNFRPGRRPTAQAVQQLMGQGLDEEQLRRRLMEVFRRTTEDDLETLADLGLLVEVDWRDGSHVPAALADADRADLDDLLARIVSGPKRPFHPGTAPDVVERLLDGDRSGGRLRAARRLLRRS